VPDGQEDPGLGVGQDIHAARDAYVAGRDLTVHYHAAGAAAVSDFRVIARRCLAPFFSQC
jgi:hypothetical protein